MASKTILQRTIFIALLGASFTGEGSLSKPKLKVKDFLWKHFRFTAEAQKGLEKIPADVQKTLIAPLLLDTLLDCRVREKPFRKYTPVISDYDVKLVGSIQDVAFSADESHIAIGYKNQSMVGELKLQNDESDRELTITHTIAKGFLCSVFVEPKNGSKFLITSNGLTTSRVFKVALANEYAVESCKEEPESSSPKETVTFKSVKYPLVQNTTVTITCPEVDNTLILDRQQVHCYFHKNKSYRTFHGKDMIARITKAFQGCYIARISHDSTFLILGFRNDENTKLVFWHIPSQTTYTTFDLPRTVRSVEFTPDSRCVFVVDYEGYAILYHIASGIPIATFGIENSVNRPEYALDADELKHPISQNKPNYGKCSPDGSFLAIVYDVWQGANDPSLRIWRYDAAWKDLQQLTFKQILFIWYLRQIHVKGLTYNEALTAEKDYDTHELKGYLRALFLDLSRPIQIHLINLIGKIKQKEHENHQ